MADPSSQRSGKHARLMGWWFVCIGAGFVLLAIRAALAGQRWPMVALRLVVAAGFGLLGILMLGSARSKQRRD